MLNKSGGLIRPPCYRTQSKPKILCDRSGQKVTYRHLYRTFFGFPATKPAHRALKPQRN